MLDREKLVKCIQEHNTLDKNISIAYTHNGVFHVNDVLSAAILKIAYPDIIISGYARFIGHYCS